MPIKVSANITLTYWHLHANSLVSLNLLSFTIVIFVKITPEQVYLAATSRATSRVVRMSCITERLEYNPLATKMM